VAALLRPVNANDSASGRVPVKAFLAELVSIRRDSYAMSEAAIVPDTAMIAMAAPVPGGHHPLVPLASVVSGPPEHMRRNRPQVLALGQRKRAGLRFRSSAASGRVAGQAAAHSS